ncbi:sensor histidine kinase [Paenibacillus cremeus]|nr:histidine kinase [Paenibacillus cremeus]
MRIVSKELLKSLRFRIGLTFLLIFLPLMALMIYNSVYAGKVVREQVAQSNKNLVSLYLGQIDRSLEEADDYLYKMAAQETDLIVLDQPNTFETSRYQLARLRLSNKISADINNFKQMDTFFIYSSSNDDFLMGPNVSMSFDERTEARKLLSNMLQGAVDSVCLSSWCVRKIDEAYFLCHIVKMNGVYLGAWVNVERLMVPMNLIDLGETGISVLRSGSTEPTNHTRFIKENGIDLALDSDALYKITGTRIKFLVVGDHSHKGDFSLMVLMPDNRVVENLPLIQRIVSLVPIGFVMLLLVFLLILRGLILRPVNRMVKAMRRIKEGNWDAQIPTYPASTEFEVMHTTFNEMVSQIQKLKIDVYEEQLNNQRAELKHLQLQINPHFFLNSLNIVYHLAQAKKYELIQEMSLSLVEYFRFMFRSNLTFVSLKDEIKHTQNYLNIQLLRFPRHLTYEIEEVEAFENTKVPPLVVQTFVENTIKHSVTTDDPIQIRIMIQSVTVNGGDGIRIRISDTGKGFPDDVLHLLQSDQDLIKENGEHVGIWNVKRRLYLLYKDQARITFMNAPEGGAVVEIVLPCLID